MLKDIKVSEIAPNFKLTAKRSLKICNECKFLIRFQFNRGATIKTNFKYINFYINFIRLKYIISLENEMHEKIVL